MNSENIIKVILKENLTCERAQKYKDILYGVVGYVVDEIFDNDDFRDEMLKDDDYVFMEVMFGDIKYYIIHGFPGDNPKGFVINTSGEIIDTMPPDDLDNLTEIGAWYEACMVECICECTCDYCCPRNHKDRHYWFWDEKLN